MSLVAQAISAIEAGCVPDSVTRMGIRKLLRDRLQSMQTLDCEAKQEAIRRFIADASRCAIAELPDKANEQHYEVPPEFFRHALGPRLKYSCCYWTEGNARCLAEAEDAALEITSQHAELQDGMEILELGCGWGSLSLWMAEKFPNSRILAVSNSHQQRGYIEEQAQLRELKNLIVQTADMNEFRTERRFDRVVSVEMFEHMRNHRELMGRISKWLTPAGKLFVHIFCHRDLPYLFEDQGPQDWMTRYFFGGGMMPSDSLLLNYQQHLTLENQWRWNGQHYQKTCDAWLQQQDASREEILRLFEQAYGKDAANCWFQRWRIFFMACAELFGYHEGNEWWVSHYLFANNSC